jgi:hypothetical protein
MFKTVKVKQLVDKVRQIADLEESQFVTDPEIIGYINDAREFLYSKLFSVADPALFSEEVALVKNINGFFELPPYFQLLEVSVNNSVLTPSNRAVSAITHGVYVVQKMSRLYTHPDHASITLQYVPLLPELSQEDVVTTEEVETEEEGVFETVETTLDMLDQELSVLPVEIDYISLKVAIRAMKKGENPVTDLERDLDALYKRVSTNVIKATHTTSKSITIHRRHR